MTCYANLSVKSGQTHLEMFEIKNLKFPHFSKNRARNYCYSRLMIYTSLKVIIKGATRKLLIIQAVYNLK